MNSVQDLHKAAEKERQKAEDYRKQAEKQRLKVEANLQFPEVIMAATNEAQKLEEKAAQHDQAAAKFVEEATGLEAKVLELNRKKNEIMETSQAQMDQLDKEEQALRG